jgi:hypothetical protein
MNDDALLRAQLASLMLAIFLRDMAMLYSLVLICSTVNYLGDGNDDQ